MSILTRTVTYRTKLPPYHQGRDELPSLHAPLSKASLVTRAARKFVNCSACLTLHCIQNTPVKDAAILAELLPRDVMTQATHAMSNALTPGAFLSLH